MDRRNFIKSALYSSVAYSAGAGSLFTFSNALASNTSSTVSNRVLVNLMLTGGADQRYLFVPEPGSAYAAKFWEKRQSIYRYNAETQALYNSYEDVWNALYQATDYNGTIFGIHKNAAWLRSQFISGNVAIVSNMVGSANRRHDHSQLIMHTGDVTTGQFNVDRDGWGGRLVNSSSIATGIDEKAVCMSTDVLPYCHGLNPGDRLEDVVHIRNSRSFALPVTDAGSQVSSRNVLARALKSYYAKRGSEVEDLVTKGELPERWPFRRFFKHEKAIREFGDTFEQRLEDVMPTLPYTMQRLLTGFGTQRLSSRHFAQEMINLYDSMLGADILRLKTAYIEYSGWDTHKRESFSFERNITDLFGFSKGLHSVSQALATTQGANENLTYVVTSDFGRQIAANGDNGTDHGSGTYGIIIGSDVNGGVYGEMFPQSEITPDPAKNNLTQFDIQGTDITGRTSFEHVLGAACDWASPGSGSDVFTNLASATPPIIEPGVDASALFRPGYSIYGTISLENGNHPTSFGSIITVTASNANGVVNQGIMKGSGQFRIASLPDDSYTLTPTHQYFTFTPASITQTVSGGDVIGINFIGIPQLHIYWAFKYSYTNPAGELVTAAFIQGYNFVPGDTTVTVGGTPVPVNVGSSNWMSLQVTGIPPTGEIVVTTGGVNPETYTHSVLFENL